MYSLILLTLDYKLEKYLYVSKYLKLSFNVIFAWIKISNYVYQFYENYSFPELLKRRIAKLRLYWVVLQNFQWQERIGNFD